MREGQEPDSGSLVWRRHPRAPPLLLRAPHLAQERRDRRTVVGRAGNGELLVCHKVDIGDTTEKQTVSQK